MFEGIFRVQISRTFRGQNSVDCGPWHVAIVAGKRRVPRFGQLEHQRHQRLSHAAGLCPTDRAHASDSRTTWRASGGPLWEIASMEVRCWMGDAGMGRKEYGMWFAMDDFVVEHVVLAAVFRICGGSVGAFPLKHQIFLQTIWKSSWILHVFGQFLAHPASSAIPQPHPPAPSGTGTMRHGCHATAGWKVSWCPLRLFLHCHRSSLLDASGRRFEARAPMPARAAAGAAALEVVRGMRGGSVAPPGS